MCDIALERHGSVTLIRPCSPEGEAWVESHVEAEPWQLLGGAIAADPRLAVNVLDGAAADGLSVECR